MHVLVTGGAGYIGSSVVKALLTQGHEVTVFDNMSTGSKENLLRDASYVHGDILHIPSLAAVCANKVDAIVHLAARKSVEASMQAPERYADSNIVGTLRVLEQMIVSEIPVIVFSSSAAVYGSPRYLPIDEAHPTEPENFYGFTKLEMERILAWYSTIKGIRFAALRYFNAAGQDPEGNPPGIEAQPTNLLPIIMQVANGSRSQLEIFGDDFDTPDGTGVRDYIHVSDLATAHVKALEYLFDEQKDLVVNLGTEKGLSVQEMLVTARAVTKREIPAVVSPRRKGDPAHLVASSSRAYSLLDWKPTFVDAADIVESAWRQYKLLGG